MRYLWILILLTSLGTISAQSCYNDRYYKDRYHSKRYHRYNKSNHGSYYYPYRGYRSHTHDRIQRDYRYRRFDRDNHYRYHQSYQPRHYGQYYRGRKVYHYKGRMFIVNNGKVVYLRTYPKKKRKHYHRDKRYYGKSYKAPKYKAPTYEAPGHKYDKQRHAYPDHHQHHRKKRKGYYYYKNGRLYYVK